MDYILVAGIGDEADDFGPSRRVGRVWRAIIHIPLNVSLMDDSTVVKLAVTNLARFC
jgi:hypothetical protein